MSVSYHEFILTAPRVGLEPTTTRLTAECSTIELSRITPEFLNSLFKGLLLQNCTLKFFHPITLKNNSLCSIQTLTSFG